MALGGGVFLTQNKVLPGAYINIVSAARATATLSDRGFLTMPLELDWGVDDEVFEVTSGDLQKNSLSMFGYNYTDEKLKGLRDVFANAKVLFAYRLNSGVKASNEFATAKYSGIRGNDIAISIKPDIDNGDAFIVTTLLDNIEVDIQTVTDIAELKGNKYVVWKKTALSATVATPLTGGTNGDVTGNSHQKYLSKIENYAFNILGVVTEDKAIKGLYASFTKRLRDEVGAKFQTVLHNYSADYEGVINVKNDVINNGDSKASLVYWVAGLEAGCNVNKSCMNTKYKGEFDVLTDFTQRELENCVNSGEFVLHNVNKDIRVLMDINSLVTVTDEKGIIFKENQTMRVADQIANDTAFLFANKYLGIVPNDKMGRTALWSDIVKHRQELLKIRAIQDFKSEDITVAEGDEKNGVVVNELINVVNAMAKLYMTTTIS